MREKERECETDSRTYPAKSAMHSTTEQRAAGEIKRQRENLCQRLVMPRIYGFDYRRGVRYARGAILYE